MTKKFLIISVLIIVIANIFLYIQTRDHFFSNYDDDRYVFKNAMIKEVNAENVKEMFTKTYFRNYQPLVHLSYALDYKIFGMNPKGFHLTNIILHIVNSLLVFLFAFLLLKDDRSALIIALIFSVHPIQVESVAWVAERKGLLCALFYIPALIAYIQHLRRQKLWLYLLTMFFFICAILSKPTAITFPIILILIDYYEERLTSRKLIEKVPYFLVAGVFTLMIIHAQGTVGMKMYDGFSTVISSIFFKFYTIAFYAGKLMVPVELSVHYIYPSGFSYASFEFAVSIAVIGALILYIKNFSRISRTINFGILFFVAGIIPVLRIVPVGDTFAAERYMYVPMIGFFIAFIAALKPVISKHERLRRLLVASGVLYLLVLSGVTFTRAKIWKHDFMLWSDVLENDPDNGRAHYNVGYIYYGRSEMEKARHEFKLSLETMPNDPRVNLAYANILYLRDGDEAAAAVHYKRSLLTSRPEEGTLNPALNNLSTILISAGRYAETEELMRKFQDDYEYSGVLYYNFARALAGQNKFKEAVEKAKMAFDHGFREPYVFVDTVKYMIANGDTSGVDELIYSFGSSRFGNCARFFTDGLLAESRADVNFAREAYSGYLDCMGVQDDSLDENAPYVKEAKEALVRLGEDK